MTKLPKFIQDAIASGDTSLGRHSAFPPSDEEDFVRRIVRNKFASIADKFTTDNKEEIRKTLSRMVSECTRRESANKAALEQLCVNYILDTFRIPKDSIGLEVSLVADVKKKNVRMHPEETPDFSFDSVKEMNALTEEIYKRRMINALICGASDSIGWNLKGYVSELYRIDGELINLYDKIHLCAQYLLYVEDDDAYLNGMSTGYVDVFVKPYPEKARIESQGVILPCLITETVKGILEYATISGLPEDSEKAEYILKKSDFKHAEPWDMRLGIPLWGRIEKCFDAVGEDIDSNMADVFFKEISTMESSDFDETLAEVFANTKSGRDAVEQMVSDIDADDEDIDVGYGPQMDGEYVLDDDGEFTAEELRMDLPILGEYDLDESFDVSLNTFMPVDSMNTEFWDEDRHLDSRIRLALLDIADDFIDTLGITWVKPSDIVMTGSMCNYNWNKYSDIDVHVIMDYSEVFDDTDIVKSYFDSKKNEWKRKHDDLTIKGHDVELYVEDLNNPSEASAVYSLEKDEWVKTPHSMDSHVVDRDTVKEAYKTYKEKIKKLTDAIWNEDDLVRLEKYRDELKAVFDDLKAARKKALATEEKELSVDNIVWKMLRAGGYIEELNDALDDAYDRLNSIDEAEDILKKNV